jgi:type II secretory pathway component GspD/PulD (secretin)
LGGSGVGVAQFQLKHNNAALLAEPIKTILTRDGKVTVMESENRLVVVDHPHAIETIQKLVSELDAPGSGLRVVQFAPSHLRVASLTEAIRSLLSKDGRININDAENRLIVIDYPHIIRKVETLFQDADTPRNGLRSIDLRAQNTDAKDLQNAVASLLSKDGKVALVDNENRLVISDYPANLERIEDMFRQLDTARSQVRITALIYDMSTEDIYRVGLNWNHSLKDNHNAAGAPQTGFSIDSLMQVPQAAGSPASVITLWNLNRAFDIRAVIDAMNNCTDSRLLADPSVVVVDRKTAQFKIVTEVPLQQLTQTGQTNIGTTQFKEAGVVLKVTPRIANDATIEMQLTPTFSRLAGYTPGAAPQPIFDRREADTTVRIANQQVFVVGGLRQRNEINQNRGIPGLKDIKKFQFHRLWSSEGREFRESELIVFVSPELVTPCYNGRPREQHAGEQGFQMLDEVPAFGGAQIHGSMPGPMQPGEHVLPYQPSARPTYDVLPHDELPRPQQQGPPPAGPTSNQSTQAKSAPKLTAPANDLRTATPALPAAKKPTSSSSAANKPTTTNPKVSPPNSSAVSAIPSVAAPRTVAPVALYQDELPLPNASEPKYVARVDESPVVETQVSPAAESSYNAKSEKPKSPAAPQATGSSWKNPFAAKPSSSATPASTTPRPKPSAMQTPSLVPSQNQPSRSSSFLPPPLPTSNTYQPASNTAVKSPEPSLVPTGEYFRR